MDEVKLQRAYYAETAAQYDAMHAYENQGLAVPFLLAALEMLGATSVLDVGAGTGGIVRRLVSRGVDAVGVEPVKELREQGLRHGLTPSQLIDGDGYNLAFADGAFDVVCEFAMLHHVRHPERVVLEMLRVARKGVFILDGNNFGQGGLLARIVKQAIHAIGLWPAADFLKTRGKGYTYTEGDGVAYSYSVFDSYPILAKSCAAVHVLNTDKGVNPYREASHCALLGIKR